MQLKKPIEKEALKDVYQELFDLLGYENMKIIYENYKGYQINFPTRLYDINYVREVVKREYNGRNIKELSRRFDYSERWIRKIVADVSVGWFDN